MNLDIIAQLVQILKDAPEVGAIEVRRGLLGRWSTIRVTKVGHASNAGSGGGGRRRPWGGGVTVRGEEGGPGGQGGGGGGGGGGGATHLVEIKSPMVGTFYSAPEPGAEPYVKVGTRTRLGSGIERPHHGG